VAQREVIAPSYLAFRLRTSAASTDAGVNMTKRILVACLVALFLLSSGVTANADPGGDTSSFDRGASDTSILALITDDDAFSLADLSLVLVTPLVVGGANRTQHYGPFPSGSPDSGTCGLWAQDTYDLHFTVRPNGLTYTVVAQYKRGDFVVDHFGPSPGSCDAMDGSPPGTVDAGVTGKLHGYIIMTVTGTQSNEDPSCVAFAPATPCTRTGFINSHFAGTTTIDTFFFHYSAGDQGLVEHEWKNASEDRGGNHGDIRSTDAP
jgi:hypothetical protein